MRLPELQSHWLGPFVVGVALTSGASLFLSKAAWRANAFAQAPDQATTTTTSLPAEKVVNDVAILKDKIPDQSHAMTDVDYHFSNLWFAAHANNWPLATFYWNESISHMKWAVRIIPVRKDAAGQEIKLGDILQAIENSPYMQIGKTIEAKDLAEFEKAYRFTLDGCYSCHKAADKPYLRPHIPERPASSMINFDPHAVWPK
jgi:hypothetical protein